jgi:hypothetical protein
MKVGQVIQYLWNGKLKSGKIISFKHGVPNVKEIKLIDK